MTAAAALRLARVSNLPTVWTNVLAGVVLAGGALGDLRLVPLLVAFSLFYVGGMFLNDFFDREIDAVERPTRPLPSGEAAPGGVLVAGMSMLAVGLALLAWVGVGPDDGTGWRPLAAGAALVVAILAYDLSHKQNRLSPAVMAACRALVYIGAGFAATAGPDAALYAGAALVFCYLVGLTYVARQEHLNAVGSLWPLAVLGIAAAGAVAFVVDGRAAAVLPLVLFLGALAGGLSFVARRRPGDVGRAVVTLIAGISLLDSTFLASRGAYFAALLAAAAFVATLGLQRYVAGT